MKKLFLVLIIICLKLVNLFSLNVGGEFYSKYICKLPTKNKPKIFIANDWLLEKNHDYYFMFGLYSEDEKKVEIDNVIFYIKSNNNYKIKVEEFKNISLNAGEYKDLKVNISKNIVNKLKPKEYKLKVIMIEDGKEKVIGERDRITIDGSHLEKIEKKYTKVEFKETADFLKKDYYYETGSDYRMFNDQATLNRKLPKVELFEIKNNNIYINDKFAHEYGEKMGIIYNKKTNINYNLEFRLYLKSSYDIDFQGKEGRGYNEEFYGDIIIGLSNNKKQYKFDYILKKLENTKIELAKEKPINCNLNLKDLKDNYYKILLKLHHKDKKTNKITKKNIYRTDKDNFFIVNNNKIKSYNVFIRYKLKNKGEGEKKNIKSAG